MTITTSGPIRSASLLAIFAGSAACISPNSPLLEAGDECIEFHQTTSGVTAEVDAKVKVFMEAAADFEKVAAEAKVDVQNACASVATDLGAENTWAGLGDVDAAMSNEQHTGACDAAARRIGEIMDQSSTVSFALMVTRGSCHCDFDALTACDESCDVDQACEPGDVETRCEPGQVSTHCEGSCMASSFCEGTEELAANCMGHCESTCVGQCDGECIAADGTTTMNDPNCHGKCASSCNGACQGACEVTAQQGVECGAEVRCRGTCSGTATDPICESVITPADCSANQECHDSCSAKIAANPICDPTRVELFADAGASSDVHALVDTINKNFSKLWTLAETKGPIIVQAVENLAVTGEAVAHATGDLSGKSLSCAKTASQAATTAAATIRVVTSASANVTQSCASRAQ
jgi:hypothetical protein